MDRSTTQDGGAGEGRPDAVLVQLVADGDRAALAELYDRHADVVFSLACRIVGSPADAEDVVQEVFTQAWRQAGRYDPGRASAAAWLLNITRTRAIDRFRANRTRLRVSADEKRVEVAAAGGEDQEQRAIGAQRAGRVRAALELLGEAQRKAIELAYFRGLTHGEIAAHLGGPLGTIKTQIRSGLLKLRDALAERT